MTRLWFQSFLLPSGWTEQVEFEVAHGRIQSVRSGGAAQADSERHAIGLPGMPNLHSHAFQRALAGRTEFARAAGDSFWSWRDAMYGFVDVISPDDLEVIAAFAFMQMLEAGFTRVGEFHYLHHDRGGRRFLNPGTMAQSIAAAASSAGIGLTLLPAFYAHSGFGGAPADHRQARFVSDIDGYAQLLDACRAAVAPLDDPLVGVAPHSLRACTPDELRAVIALAGDAPVHIHVAEQVKEVEDCLEFCGRRPIALLLETCDVGPKWCLIHATHADPREIEQIARAGATIGLCPLTEANLGDGIFPATGYATLSGSYGIGSDSNVLIDPPQELRMLEYSQRLARKSRNLMSRGDGRSTGRTLWDSALSGGSRALGLEEWGASAGSAADLLSLDANHDALVGQTGDFILDALIFAARTTAIDCVWRFGVKVVSGGRHRHRDPIARAYHQAIARLFG
jgi:formiminoglutamate deiminase